MLSQVSTASIVRSTLNSCLRRAPVTTEQYLTPRPRQNIIPISAVHGKCRYIPARTTTSSADTATPGSSKHSEKHKPLMEGQKDRIRQMIRVNQAGELGADRIYRGQHLVLGTDKKVGDVIMEMWEQEKVHLRTFDNLIAHHRVRPTVMRPLRNVAGLALGMGTAMLGREAAMACTEAVETVIGEHYNDQLRELLHLEGTDVSELRKIIKQFRDEELHHLDTAVHYESGKAPMYPLLTSVIKQGCKAAIAVSQRF